MTTDQILKKFLDFYKKKGHKQISNVSLIPKDDSSLLYVNSGMFPLVPYLLGEPHPLGTRLVNIQRALRFFEDLDNVGETNRHTTAFHMIGNWSLGDYFKKEQLQWSYEFFIEVLGLDVNKMYATVFEGDQYASKDTESIEILKKVFKKYGINAKEGERIFAYDREENWWQRGDVVGEVGGPDSEIFYYIGDKGVGLGQDPAKNQDDFLEIGNSVFIQYKKTKDGWKEISQKNVDFGGGLERLALILQGKEDIFETDNFWPMIEEIQKVSNKEYGKNKQDTKAMRILSDHIRSATLLAMDGVVPSNKDQGYILRRLLRRMARAGRDLEIKADIDISASLVGVVISTFAWLYPDLKDKQSAIKKIFSEEEKKFEMTLKRASGPVGEEIEKLMKESKDVNLDMKALASLATTSYQSYGYPREMTLEDAKEKGLNLDEEKYWKLSKGDERKHQTVSRKSSEKKFKGGLADVSEETMKLHTTTHLLHESLRRVLGKNVWQKGSNITSKRLRFDFTNSEKLTDKEIKKVEDMINKQIEKDLPVTFETMTFERAKKEGALAFFGEKYGKKVKVYSIGDFSKEVCGGPHVTHTGLIGRVRIKKEESAGAGIRRIYAEVLPVQ